MPFPRLSRRRRSKQSGSSRPAAIVAAILGLTLLTMSLSLLTAGPAAADTAPVAPVTTSTVSTDALATVQVNGVVWKQLIVGNTVYATGSFTSARPAGSAAGTNETSRSNILPYNLSTGALITTWAPTLNAQGLALAASPDGTRIYVGGDFTSVSGVAKNRIVALNASTGAVIGGFSASVNSRVRSLVATADTVYVGGAFTTSSGTARSHLAAFTASTGALTTWAPVADAEVMAIVAPAGSGKIVAGGRFANLAGQAAFGMGAVDITTGASLPWAANTVVQNKGSDAAIYSLSTDGTNVFGTGYTYLVNAGDQNDGNFENTFSATVATGALTWVSGCRGDTYDAAPVNGALYFVSHTHDCSAIGGNPQTNPVWTYQHAWAQQIAPAADGRVNQGGNFNGRPAPELLHWLPSLDVGSYTGQSQAAWTVTGNSQYVVLGGEFPKVNGTAQQGLVRFAVSSVAPNKDGPQITTSLTPTVVSLAAGRVRISWQASWDRDNENLTYEVLRGSTVIATLTQGSAWYNRPNMFFNDTTAAAGSTQTYRIRVHDAFNNTGYGPTTTFTVPTGGATSSSYASAVLGDGATHLWRLGESSGSTGYDWAAADDLALDSSATRGADGAMTNESTAKSTTFAGTAAVPAATSNPVAGPQSFTEEAWFKTTSSKGGKIIGFGDSNTATSSNYDRHIYMTNAGNIVFGVYANGTHTVTSPLPYNDGQWHQVVASLDSSGTVLYVDGQRVGQNTGVTSAQVFSGYWRVGGDNLGGWPSQPASNDFSGGIEDVAIYPAALTVAQVQSHYQASGRSNLSNQKPTASFSSATTDLTVTFDGSASADPDGTIASYAWDFGDGSTGTGATASHSYATADSFTVTLKVTDNSGATDTVSHSVTTTLPANQKPTAAFSQTCTNLACTFSGSASADPDGTIASYAWDFGDGGTSTSANPSHTFAAGTYSVKLTVTDNRGGTDSVTQSVTVAAANQSPTAAFTPTCTNLACSFDSSASVDPDGTIASYAWDFGDGSTSTSANPSHTFAAGTYTVTLVVTDNKGGTGTASSAVTVTAAPNQNPTAAFTPTCTNLACSFDSSASADPDGTIASYAWDFGDGSTSTTAKPSHTFTAAGTYSVQLTVTDNRGGTNAVTQSVTVAKANQAPTAAFTPTCTNLACSFDSSAAADSDGTITSYLWDFGDGSTSTSAGPSHTYAAAGTYTVSLTVTDNQGATGTASQPVTVTASASVLATDSFSRTVTNGLGSADTGGVWTLSGASSNFAVNGSAGSMKMPTAGYGLNGYLNSVSATDTDSQVSFSVDKVGTGNGVYITLVGRKNSAGEYRARARLLSTGGVAVQLSRYVGTTETVIGSEQTVSGLTYAAGTQLKLRMQVTGSGTTSLQMKVWRADGTEPATWQRTGTDTTASLQSAGAVGLETYLSGSSTNAPITASFDDLKVTKP